MTTTKLNITEMTASQSQKHVTFNEALATLDALVQLSVLDKDLTAPPGSPATGDAYIVGSSATGDWASKDGEVTVYDGDGWVFHTPNNGWFCWIEDEAAIYFYSSGWSALGDVLGSDYLPLAGGTMSGLLTIDMNNAQLDLADDGGSIMRFLSSNSVSYLSVDPDDVAASSKLQINIDGSEVGNFNEYGFGVGGASADASNAFAFYGTNMLFNSGSDINMKFNKNASGDDASVTFQQGFTTYAVMGLLGDNEWTLKTGASFNTAIVADADGDVTFPNQTTIRAIKHFGGRWTMKSTDNRWNGQAYSWTETRAVNAGTGSDPDIDYDAMSELFFKAGSVITKVEGGWKVNNAEVTDVYWKLYFQYNAWDGNADTTGEVTRVELNGGTLTPSGAALALNYEDFYDGSYTCPGDGYLLFFAKPNGTLTADRYLYVGGQVDCLLKSE